MYIRLFSNSLCSWAWPWTLNSPNSQELGLQTCTTVPGLKHVNFWTGIHVCVCVHMLAHVLYVHVYGCSCTRVYMRRLEGSIKCLLQSLWTLFFETESLTEAGAHPLSEASWPMSSRESPVTVFSALGLQVQAVIAGFFMWVWRCEFRSSYLSNKQFIN